MADRLDVPPIDAIPGWPTPEQQGSWLGGASVEEHLRDAYLGGRMHHAWLIGGPKGIGKATLAFRLARFVLANPDPAMATPGSSLAVEPDSRVFRQIAAGAHPNLLILRRPWDDQVKRYRNELTVGEVRRIQSLFGLTAGNRGARICIVDAADELNISAANALLKVLEEPPVEGLFLLVSNRPGQLLPTIRSRCRRLELKPIPRDEIRAALVSGEPDADAIDIDLAASLSSGSLRRAIEFLGDEGGGTYRSFVALTSALPNIDFEGVHALADNVATRGQDEAYRNFVGIVEDWLSRRLRSGSEAGQVLPNSVTDTPLASWAVVWEKVRDTTLQAETLNLDRKQVVLQVFLALAAATRV